MDGNLLHTIRRYLRIWMRSVIVQYSIIATTRLDFISFMLGKVIRMGFFLVFFTALFAHVPTIGGFSEGEVLLIFAGMNLIDVLTQLIWFRGLTDLQRLIRTGEFDVVLTKPISPLFWSAFRIFDFIDLATVPLTIAVIVFALSRFETLPDPFSLLLGLLMLIPALLVAFAINLIFAALNFWTTEIGNAWWLYRDIVYLSRFPPSIFPHAVRILFIYVFPVFVVTTFPALAAAERLTPWMFAWALIAALLWLVAALTLWKNALRHYTSASS